MRVIGCLGSQQWVYIDYNDIIPENNHKIKRI